MAISLDLNVFGKKYFVVLFYEWDTFHILNERVFRWVKSL